MIENSTKLGIKDKCKSSFYISDEELNHHVFISGATGCGKTSTVKNFLLSAIKRDLPLIYIDGKADQKLPEEIRELCKEYNRNFKYFKMSVNSEFKYNPLTSGGFTELKDKIIFMFDQMNRPVDIIAAENEYLQLVFKVLEKWLQTEYDKQVDLYNLALYIKEEKLNKVALAIGDKELIDQVVEVTQRLNSKVGCLISEINSLIFSQIGHLFKCDENDKVINLEEDIKNKSIIYFSLSDLNYSVYASQIGKLIINDLKVIFGNTSEDEPLNSFIVFDEFTTYAGNEFNSLIARARSKGLHVIICSQGFNAIRQSNAELAANLSTNCNTFIIL